MKSIPGLEMNERNEIEVKDVNAFIKYLIEDREITDSMSFAGRGDFLRPIIDEINSATEGRSMSKDEFLSTINEPAFDNLPNGAMVAAYEDGRRARGSKS